MHYQIDASRYIAYLTIEKRGAVPKDLAAKIGRNVFGCDICREFYHGTGMRRFPTGPELQLRTELVDPALDLRFEQTFE